MSKTGGSERDQDRQHGFGAVSRGPETVEPHRRQPSNALIFRSTYSRFANRATQIELDYRHAYGSAATRQRIKIPARTNVPAKHPSSHSIVWCRCVTEEARPVRSNIVTQKLPKGRVVTQPAWQVIAV
jgi:hypothetical protein